MPNIFELLGKKKTPNLIPKSMGIKTGEEVKRVAQEELEERIYNGSSSFNGINVYVKMALTTKPEIICSNEREQKIMDDFRKRTRLDGLVLPSMVQHLCIYGKSWNEKVFNDPRKNNGKKIIIKLDPMDPKFMDFRRDEYTKRIIWDEYGEPASYVEYLKFDIPRQPVEITQLGKRAIEFPKDKIEYTPLYTLGDSWEGIGLIEPSYNSARRKFETLQGIAHSIKRVGFPLVGLEVGTDSVFPTQEMIDNAAEEFKKLDEKTTIAYPNYVKPTIIESKNIERIRKNADLFTEEEIAGLGLPRALVMGSGESTNRSTLEMQMILVFQTMGMIQNRISISMEDQVFPELVEEFNFEETPVLKWADPSESFMKKVKKVSRFLPKAKQPEERPEEEDKEKEKQSSLFEDFEEK